MGAGDTQVKLIGAVKTALAGPDLARRIRDLGAEPGSAFGKDFAAFMTAEARKKWDKVIRRAGRRERSGLA